MPAVSTSDNGFQSNCFSAIWAMLHMLSLNYAVQPTRDDMRNYAAFFASLQHVLPCRSCRESYGEFITKGPLRLSRKHLADRASLARWVYDLHNAVNRRIGKHDYEVPFADMCAQYEKSRAQTCVAHGCSASTPDKKRKAVVVYMPAKLFDRLGFRSGILHL